MGISKKLNKYTGKFDLVRDEAVLHFKDPVDAYANLPVSSNSENDCRFTKDTDDLWVWSIASASGNLTDWKQIPLLSNVDLDDIADGTTYEKVLATVLDAGKLKSIYATVAGSSISGDDVKGAVDYSHAQNTDGKLDDGGVNEVTAANAKDAVDKKHSANGDTDLDATFEDTFVKKADTVNVLSDITSTGANIEDAVTKKHANTYDLSESEYTELTQWLDSIVLDSGGGITMSADLDLGDHNITNVGEIDLDLIRADAVNGSVTIELDNFAGADLIVGNNNALVVEGDNDRIGIRTSTPHATLEVAGIISQTGLGDSLIIGDGAGAADDLTNNENVFLGKETGRLCSSGSENTGIGRRALYFLVTGNKNMALGANALGKCTGSENTGIGNESLYRNQIGTGNVAIGHAAGKGTADNNYSHNIFVGFQTGDNVTTGSDNIIIGYDLNLTTPTTSNELNIGGLILGDISTKNLNVLNARKFTIEHTDLTDADTSEDEVLFTLPAGAMVQDVYAYVTTQFTGGGNTAVTVAVGTTDADLLAEEHDILGTGDGAWILEGQTAMDKGTGLYEPTDKTRKNYIPIVNTDIIAEFTTTDGTCAGLTTGSIDIFIVYLVAK